jgi:hypothetical protein
VEHTDGIPAFVPASAEINQKKLTAAEEKAVAKTVAKAAKEGE